jgi:hypothetical protein
VRTVDSWLHLEPTGTTPVTQDFDDRELAAGNETSCTPADLFAVLWAVLVEMLGAPTTATLMRRSARQRMGEYPELEELVITRQGFDYSYAVPAAWTQANEQSTALHALFVDLCALLLELTGPVVVRRLKELPQLTKCGLVVPERTL